MSNAVVPATAEAMPAARFNRSAIMKAAWDRYRHWHSVRESIHGPRAFDRKEFAFKLQLAWAEARRETMTPIERRRDYLQGELAAMSYKSAHINIEPRRSELQAALASLAA